MRKLTTATRTYCFVERSTDKTDGMNNSDAIAERGCTSFCFEMRDDVMKNYCRTSTGRLMLPLLSHHDAETFAFVSGCLA